MGAKAPATASTITSTSNTCAKAASADPMQEETNMRNPFKTSLRRGDKLIGLWLSLADPYSAEVCATAGFHWLLIDNEHAPNDVRSTLAQLQAVAPYPSHPVVRVVNADPAI